MNDVRASHGDALMPERLTPHALRRTFASLALAHGRDVRFVMAQLGHADPKMTLAVYAQVVQHQEVEPPRAGGSRKQRSEAPAVRACRPTMLATPYRKVPIVAIEKTYKIVPTLYGDQLQKYGTMPTLDVDDLRHGQDDETGVIRLWMRHPDTDPTDPMSDHDLIMMLDADGVAELVAVLNLVLGRASDKEIEIVNREPE